MPWEHVGGCSAGQMPGDRAWILFCYEMAISYLAFVLGDPPDGCWVGIMWHEHDYGEYPSVGVHWDHPQTDPPWKYIRQCETALSRFDEAVSWFDISPREIEAELESEFEDADEPDSED